MAYVTYLLGAGASANAIPPVNGMADSLLRVANEIVNTFYEQPFKENEPIPDPVNNVKVLEIRDELNWLSNICRTHYSVDTYAKKLFIKHGQNSRELFRLKNTLSLYFTIQQVLDQSDVRYDNFWASILNTQSAFPEKLRVISWNYDSQLELSYKDFSSANTLDEAYENINAYSFYDDLTRLSPKEFGIFKLNGSAKSYKAQSDSKVTAYLLNKLQWPTKKNADYKASFFDELYKLYSELKINPMLTLGENKVTAISFAWEHDLESDYYSKMEKAICDTEILVVIGYSFPFFNRKIDQKIINGYMPKLEEVYFQAPESDVENLRERFLTFSEQRVKAFTIKDLNQFYFPNELEI